MSHTPAVFTYERIGTHWSGRPVYVVSLDGVELGVIEPYRASTDRPTHRGSRIRRPGRGRDEFRRSDYRAAVAHARRGGASLTISRRSR